MYFQVVAYPEGGGGGAMRATAPQTQRVKSSVCTFSGNKLPTIRARLLLGLFPSIHPPPHTHKRRGKTPFVQQMMDEKVLQLYYQNLLRKMHCSLIIIALNVKRRICLKPSQSIMQNHHNCKNRYNTRMFQREVEKEEKLTTNKPANDTDLKSTP